MVKVVEKRDGREAGEEHLLLDEIAREGARRMLIEALKAEVDDYVECHRSERDEQGRALVVRNGRAQTRKVTRGAGTVELQAPRVNDRRLDESGRGRFRFGRIQCWRPSENADELSVIRQKDSRSSSVLAYKIPRICLVPWIRSKWQRFQ